MGGVKVFCRFCQTFLDSIIGKSFFAEEGWSSSYSLCFYTDAAQFKGYGLIFTKQWACRGWPESFTEYSISFLEIFYYCRWPQHLVSRVETGE